MAICRHGGGPSRSSAARRSPSGALNRYELRRYYRAIMPEYLPGEASGAVAARSHRRRVAVVAARSRGGRTRRVGPARGEMGRRRLAGRIDLAQRKSASGSRDSRRLAVRGRDSTTRRPARDDAGAHGVRYRPTRPPSSRAVERLDALARATDFKVPAVEELAAQHRHARGLRQLETALDLVDAGAQSPKETWLRLLLIRAGFPRPQTQIPVLSADGYRRYYLDMGWEDIKLAVEYDGEQHRDRPDPIRLRHPTIGGSRRARLAQGQGRRAQPSGRRSAPRPASMGRPPPLTLR